MNSKGGIRLAFRYLTSGGISYLVYAGILLSGRYFPDTRLYLSIVGLTAFVIANIVNYLLHYFFTYQSNNDHGITILKFSFVVIFGALGLVILITTLHSLISANALLALELVYALAWPVISAILLTFFVFAKKN